MKFKKSIFCNLPKLWQHFFLRRQDEEKRTAVYVSLRILYQAQKQELLNYCREKSWEFQIEMEKDPCIRDLVRH